MQNKWRRVVCKSVSLSAVFPRVLFWFVAVDIFKSFELLNESLVLVFQHGDAVLQTLHIFFLFPATFSGRLPVTNQTHLSVSAHTYKHAHAYFTIQVFGTCSSSAGLLSCAWPPLHSAVGCALPPVTLP